MHLQLSFQLSFLKYELFRPKNADIFEIKAQIKKFTVQKSLRMCFMVFLGGHKIFWFSSNFEFLWDALWKIFFFYFTLFYLRLLKVLVRGPSKTFKIIYMLIHTCFLHSGSLANESASQDAGNGNHSEVANHNHDDVIIYLGHHNASRDILLLIYHVYSLLTPTQSYQDDPRGAKGNGVRQSAKEDINANVRRTFKMPYFKPSYLMSLLKKIQRIT